MQSQTGRKASPPDGASSGGRGIRPADPPTPTPGSPGRARRDPPRVRVAAAVQGTCCGASRRRCSTAAAARASAAAAATAAAVAAASHPRPCRGPKAPRPAPPPRRASRGRRLACRHRAGPVRAHEPRPGRSAVMAGGIAPRRNRSRGGWRSPAGPAVARAGRGGCGTVGGGLSRSCPGHGVALCRVAGLRARATGPGLRGPSRPAGSRRRPAAGRRARNGGGETGGAGGS
jgi:hypothetical protein